MREQKRSGQVEQKPLQMEYPCCGVPNRSSREFLDRIEAAVARLRARKTKNGPHAD